MLDYHFLFETIATEAFSPYNRISNKTDSVHKDYKEDLDTGSNPDNIAFR